MGRGGGCGDGGVCVLGAVAVLHPKKVVPILGILRTDTARCLSLPLPFKCLQLGTHGRESTRDPQ